MTREAPRFNALDSRMAERMAALDVRVGNAGGEVAFCKPSAAVGLRATGIFNFALFKSE